MGEGRLDGKVAIVTGGGRGIGRAHCLELASHGAAVVVNDPGVSRDGTDSGESPAEQVASEIVESGGRALANKGSVTRWTDGADLIGQTVDEFGRLDIVVNNAGIVRDKLITRTTEEDWDAVIAVHLKGTFSVTKHACDYFRSQSKSGADVRGRIINTTSGAGLKGNAGQSAYSAAKAAIVGLTLTTASEMERYNVTANAISPVAATRLSADVFTGGKANDPSLDPGQSSPLVAWLASDEAAWLTGQVLRVDGDLLVRMIGWTQKPEKYRARTGGKLDVAELNQAARLLYGTAPEGVVAQLVTN
ncbi:SDR family NAD(P)-dependent oxidoreductase [Rhodococcoides yunnanense]|uniref:SDR family NAD(P)-dependent oxidoreductase n=1 Tax=Rhodococcoides yunnanense TaxID=278209 RepID=A0ABU4BKK0_9NOCA|nr:SDR family NAD(P)-dependent oxidoreductase [Rhodococcus yunnanensis]MDV6264742.1 SDR family NAD(P)-dependent oxidoreductase [Rhodococcus yunnanensis]